MARLNYNHLRYFHAVAHADSLSAAAESLSLSQSALSSQLKKLEDQLGCALFERRGRTLALTEAGRLALLYADPIFEAGEELMAALRHGLGPGGRRPLRIGAAATLSRNFTLEFVRPLLKREDVELVIRSGSMPELLDALAAHALDVVLTNREPPDDAASAWRSRLIAEQPVALVAPPGPWAERAPFPQGLNGAPLILPARGGSVRAAFDRLLERSGVRPVYAAEVDDMAMLRLMAREGAALAVVPPIVVKDELATGRLIERCRLPGVSESFFAVRAVRRFDHRLVDELLTAADLRRLPVRSG